MTPQADELRGLADKAWLLLTKCDNTARDDIHKIDQALRSAAEDREKLERLEEWAQRRMFPVSWKLSAPYFAAQEEVAEILAHPQSPPRREQ